jgi:hypothetical protein
MVDMLGAAGYGSLSSRYKQDNPDLQADVEKLISIVQMLADTYKDFILEVHVAPMNIIQLTTAELKEMSFYIVYNPDVEDVNQVKHDCSEMLKVMIADEFDGINGIKEIKYYTYNKWTIPTIMLYTLFNDTLETLSDNDYLTLYQLTCEDAISISIPKTYALHKIKSVFVHINGILDMSFVKSKLNKYSDYNMSIRELGEQDKHTTMVFVFIMGKSPIPYDIPYIYVNSASFDEQRINELLKSNEG